MVVIRQYKINTYLAALSNPYLLIFLQV